MPCPVSVAAACTSGLIMKRRASTKDGVSSLSMGMGLGPTPMRVQAAPQKGWSPKKGTTVVGHPAISPTVVSTATVRPDVLGLSATVGLLQITAIAEKLTTLVSPSILILNPKFTCLNRHLLQIPIGKYAASLARADTPKWALALLSSQSCSVTTNMAGSDGCFDKLLLASSQS